MLLQRRAVERQVTARTHSQARQALVFLYQHIVRQPLGDLDGLVRASSCLRDPGIIVAARAPRQVCLRRLGEVLAGLGQVGIDKVKTFGVVGEKTTIVRQDQLQVWETIQV